MNINDLGVQLNSLCSKIEPILIESEYKDYEDLSCLEDYECIKNDANNLQLLENYSVILNKLQDVVNDLIYLRYPIKTEGYLKKNRYDRYELNGIELTSGNGIEWLCDSDDMYYNLSTDSCSPYWKVGRIEHNGKDYYIVGCNSENITNIKVRLRDRYA